MRRAHLVSAVTSQKFFFRKYMAPPEAEEACTISESEPGAIASCIAAAAVAVRSCLMDCILDRLLKSIFLIVLFLS